VSEPVGSGKLLHNFVSIFIEGLELCPELELVTALIINCTKNKL
jgi:hypothetical protein